MFEVVFKVAFQIMVGWRWNQDIKSKRWKMKMKLLYIKLWLGMSYFSAFQIWVKSDEIDLTYAL